MSTSINIGLSDIYEVVLKLLSIEIKLFQTHKVIKVKMLRYLVLFVLILIAIQINAQELTKIITTDGKLKIKCTDSRKILKINRAKYDDESGYEIDSNSVRSIKDGCNNRNECEYQVKNLKSQLEIVYECVKAFSGRVSFRPSNILELQLGYVESCPNARFVAKHIEKTRIDNIHSANTFAQMNENIRRTLMTTVSTNKNSVFFLNGEIMQYEPEGKFCKFTKAAPKYNCDRVHGSEWNCKHEEGGDVIAYHSVLNGHYDHKRDRRN